MSRNDPPNVLTPDRYECLRLVSICATRDAHGVLWEPQRARLARLRDHGLMTLDVVPPGSTADQRRASRKVTALGMRVLELWGKRVLTPNGEGFASRFEIRDGRTVVTASCIPGIGSWPWPIDAVSLAADEQIGAAS